MCRHAGGTEGGAAATLSSLLDAVVHSPRVHRRLEAVPVDRQTDTHTQAHLPCAAVGHSTQRPPPLGHGCGGRGGSWPRVTSAVPARLSLPSGPGRREILRAFLEPSHGLLTATVSQRP
jgi:hypothetical protein